MNDRERAGEQVAVMDEIVRVADEEAADVVIVAGDLSIFVIDEADTALGSVMS